MFLHVGMDSVLQYVAVCCSVLAVCCSVLHCVAACCNVLQCVAAGCSVLRCVAAGCSGLQCVAVLMILHIDRISINHVTYERVMSHMNGPCHI